jgi:hypothetical protein
MLLSGGRILDGYRGHYAGPNETSLLSRHKLFRMCAPTLETKTLHSRELSIV